MVDQTPAFGRRLVNVMKSDSLPAQLLRGGAGSVGVKIAATGLAFLVAVVLARSLGPEGYGVYTFVLALASLLSIPVEFGLPNLVVRETAKAEVREQWGLMRGLWRWASAAAGGGSLILALVAGSLSWAFADHFTSLQLTAFAFSLILVPLIALGNLRGAALRGLRHVVAGQLPEAMLRPAFLIALVLAAMFLWSAEGLTAADAMAFHALAAAIAFVIGAAILMKVRPEPLIHAPAPEYRIRTWARAALPLALLAGMLAINQQFSIVILGFFGGAEDVGVYRIVMQGGMLVLFGYNAVNTIAEPHLARIYASNDFMTLQLVVRRAGQAGVLVAFPIAFVFIFWGEEVLSYVFGPAFARGHMAIAILAGGQFFNSVMGLSGILLNMTGHERDTTRGVTIATGSNLILSLILIPALGINGAAIAAVASLLIWNYLLWRSAVRRLHIDSTAFGLWNYWKSR